MTTRNAGVKDPMMNRPGACGGSAFVRRSRGFTMVEMILAVSVLALIFALVGAMLSTILGGAGRIGRALSDDNLAGEIEEIIADDLAFLTPVPGKPPFLARGEGAGRSSMSFSTAAGSKTAWGEVVTPIHLVTYLVEPMPGGGAGLFRDERPLVETSAAYYDAPVLVAENVTLFKVEAFDGKQWQDEWPSSEGGILPLLVRVSIDLELDEGHTRRLMVEWAPLVEAVGRPRRKDATPAKGDESDEEKTPSGGVASSGGREASGEGESE